VLDTLASTLTIVGDSPGDGQAMKTVNQLLCGVHIAAAAEALALWLFLILLTVVLSLLAELSRRRVPIKYKPLPHPEY